MYDSLMDADLIAPTLFSKRIGGEGERGREKDWAGHSQT